MHSKELYFDKTNINTDFPNHNMTKYLIAKNFFGAYEQNITDRDELVRKNNLSDSDSLIFTDPTCTTQYLERLL